MRLVQNSAVKKDYISNSSMIIKKEDFALYTILN
jgi:hypothetical protein